MKGIVEKRAAMLGEYIIESKATVRKAAKKFGVSKSTVHKDVSQRLRGGMATKNKYLKERQDKATKNR